MKSRTRKGDHKEGKLNLSKSQVKASLDVRRKHIAQMQRFSISLKENNNNNNNKKQRQSIAAAFFPKSFRE